MKIFFSRQVQCRQHVISKSKHLIVRGGSIVSLGLTCMRYIFRFFFRRSTQRMLIMQHLMLWWWSGYCLALLGMQLTFYRIYGSGAIAINWKPKRRQSRDFFTQWKSIEKRFRCENVELHLVAKQFAALTEAFKLKQLAVSYCTVLYSRAI